MNTGRNTIRDLSHETRLRALGLKHSAGAFEAIRFLTIEHKIGLREAKQYIDTHDEFGREIRLPWIKQGNNIFVLVFTGTGILLLLIALLIYSYQYDFMSKSDRTEAVVTELKSYGNGYVAVFGYDAGNEHYLKESGTVSTSPEFDIGEKISIWVSRKDPYDIMVDSFMNRWFSILIVGTIGMFFFFFGMLFSKIF